MTEHRVVPIAALKDNYIWAIENTQCKTVLIVDPGDATPVMDYLNQNRITLAGILVTHHHWDHTNGILSLISEYQVPVFGPGGEAVAGVTQSVVDGAVVVSKEVDIHLNVLGIPGHTTGHVAYYGSGMLFTGDTLFAAGCGRLFEGTAAQMYESLQTLSRLPEQTKIYCGHEYTHKNLQFARLVEPDNEAIRQRIERVTILIDKGEPTLPSTLIEEKMTNPFLRCHMPELVKNVERFAGKTCHYPEMVFKYLREWKDSVG